MFASSAIPANASWPTWSGRTQISPTGYPRTIGIMSGPGTAPSTSRAVYESFIMPASVFHIRASTGAPSICCNRSPLTLPLRLMPCQRDDRPAQPKESGEGQLTSDIEVGAAVTEAGKAPFCVIEAGIWPVSCVSNPSVDLPRLGDRGSGRRSGALAVRA